MSDDMNKDFKDQANNETGLMELLETIDPIVSNTFIYREIAKLSLQIRGISADSDPEDDDVQQTLKGISLLKGKIPNMYEIMRDQLLTMHLDQIPTEEPIEDFDPSFYTQEIPIDTVSLDNLDENAHSYEDSDPDSYTM